jgi:hypothetical protein
MEERGMTRDHMKMLLNVVITASNTQVWTVTEEQLEKFAELVTAAEREACATVCEKQIKSYMSKQYTTDPLGGFRERFAAEQCAAAIRARGET